jgi:hypothetical protein
LSGDFERYVKRALEVEHLSLQRGFVRGNWRGVSFLGTLRIMSGKAVSYGGSVRGTWREGPTLRTRKDVYQKALETKHFFCMGFIK